MVVVVAVVVVVVVVGCHTVARGLIQYKDAILKVQEIQLWR